MTISQEDDTQSVAVLPKLNLQWSDYDPEGSVLRALKALVYHIEEKLSGEANLHLTFPSPPDFPLRQLSLYDPNPNEVVQLYPLVPNIEQLEGSLRERPVVLLHYFLLWYLDTYSTFNEK